ncbi:MAG: GWxTD domain-containing protein [candidate division Zixibacteria bacterium]|nr:GWxTD domain-containing protein [candidate division Zixibacteria bacterium]
MNKLIKIFFFLCSLTFIFSQSSAQTDFGYLEEGGGPVFSVDYASFREETGEKYRLEVYYKIFCNKLTFVKSDDRFKASYEIELSVLNKVNKQVNGTTAEEDYAVNTYEETQSPDVSLVNMINLSLYSGRYKLKIKLIDRNSGSESVLERNFTISSRNEKGVMFSDIEFIRELSDSADTSSFNKRGKKLIPSVDRDFGDSDPILRIYYEIYPDLKESRAYDLAYEIYNPGHTFSEQETTQLQIGPEFFYRFDSLSLKGIQGGDYFLSIKLLENHKEITKIEEPFKIEWSFLSMLKNDYQRFIDQLRYVATDEEIKRLKEAKEEEKLQKWLEFWKSKNPTPNTPENELQEEYYRRLKYANQNFVISNKEGWETDMGMIYIIYGHPDEVEKHPFEREEKAYQWWHYYEPNRDFLFMDRGDGEYELQPPYDGKIRSR